MNIRKVIGAPRRRGVALAATALTLGLGAGATTAGALAVAARDASTAALALRTASVRAALDTTFQRYADTMHHLAGTAATQPTATLAPALARLAGQHLPGAHQIVVIDADRTVRARHTADGSTPPAHPTLAAGPELRRGLELARDSGRLVTTAAHVLPADAALPPAHRQPAFEFVAPVRDGAGPGWVVLAVRATDLLSESLREAGISGVAAVLSETRPDGKPHEVARWAEGGAPVGDASGTVDLAAAGHSWRLQVRPTTALLGAARTAAAPLTLLAAVVLSALLAVALLAADQRRLRAEARARRATATRRTELAQHRAEFTRTERELRERETELAGFAAAVGDHLHTPLHTIAGFTEILLEDAGEQLDAGTRGFLDRMGRSTTRMLSLVGDMLAYTAARDAELKPEPVDLGGLALCVAAGRLDQEDGERPSIDVGDLPTLTADPGLLGEVLGRLVDNAVRYVRPGTAARVSLRAREHATGWWRIEVADHGIGVPAEQRDRIFAPFHRAPAAEGFSGAGLGLAVCRRIVDRHGGQLGVEPNPGGGSIFWFTMPASPVAPVAGPELLAVDLA